MDQVSVIIPTYNCPYTKEAVESVITQTYKNIEIIIVDDGSSANYAKVLKNYHPKIVYIFQENMGVSAARNTGLRVAKGKYVAFLDADDVWLPEKLEKQLEVFRTNPHVGFVYCDNYFVREDLSKINSYSRSNPLTKGDIFLDFIMHFFLITSGVVIKKQCLEKVGNFDLDFVVDEDFDFFMRMTRQCIAGVVKEKLFLRRVVQNSLSRIDFKRNARYDIKLLNDFCKNDIEYYHQNKDKIDRRLSELHYLFGYRLLIHGEKFSALEEFIRALKYHINLKTIKNIAYCLIPQEVLNIIREQSKRIKKY